MRGCRFFLILLCGFGVLSSATGGAGDFPGLSYAGATTLPRFFMPEMGRYFFEDTGIRIHIGGGNTDPSMRTAVQGLILGDAPYLSRAVVSAIVEQVDRHVAMFPGAIAVLGTSMVDDPLGKVICTNGIVPAVDNPVKGSYPLAKPLALITRGQPRDELEVFINLAKSSVGAQVLAENFVPYTQH